MGTLKADTEGSGRVIHEAETEYQYARVIEGDDGSRTLELNEGQADHSLCRAECDAGPGGPRNPASVLTGDYWDGHLVLNFASRDRPPRRVAILGNAAGTTSRAYEEFFPETRVDGVEIDSELSDIGRSYFDMNNPRMHLYHEDARPFLRRIGPCRRTAFAPPSRTFRRRSGPRRSRPPAASGVRSRAATSTPTTVPRSSG